MEIEATTIPPRADRGLVRFIGLLHHRHCFLFRSRGGGRGLRLYRSERSPFTLASSPPRHSFSRAKSMTLPVLPHPVWTSRPRDFRPAYGEGVGCCRSAGPREWERTAFVHRSILSRSTLREMTRGEVSTTLPRLSSYAFKVNLGWEHNHETRCTRSPFSFFFLPPPPPLFHRTRNDSTKKFHFVEMCAMWIDNCNWVVLKIGKIYNFLENFDIPDIP